MAGAGMLLLLLRSSAAQLEVSPDLSEEDKEAYASCMPKAPPRFLDMPRPHVVVSDARELCSYRPPLRIIRPAQIVCLTRRAPQLASYPRSGNSLTRSTLEYITQRWTGSDMCRADEGAMHVEGEGVSDSRVWVIKTHSTIDRGGPFAPFTAHRVILISRNPFKVAVSFWHFVLSNERQDASVPLETFAQFPLVWLAFRSTIASRWCAFYRYWLSRATLNKAPLLLLRYEDLVHPARAVSQFDRLHSFLYGEDAFVGAKEAATEQVRISAMRACVCTARDTLLSGSPTILILCAPLPPS